MNYVICSGGIGNQMFQYAYVVHLNQLGIKAELDVSFFLHADVHSGYELDKCFGIAGSSFPDHYKTPLPFIYSIMSKCKIHKLGSIIMEHNNRVIDEKKIGDKKVLYGFWQGEKFFSDVAGVVRRIYRFRNISRKADRLAQTMLSENSVAVHIRRGDYLYSSKYLDLTSTKYYKNALSMVKTRYSAFKVYVFSDDMEWCKKSGIFDSSTEYVVFNDKQHDYEDMYLMSKAKVLITANSTFSWWAGYLGEHEYVIRPEKYTINWTKDDDDRFYPKEWIIGRIDRAL